MKQQLNKTQIREVYGKISSSYDLWARLTETKARDRCLELAEIKDGQSILEVAVGTGMTFEKILQKNPSGWNEGFDLTTEMLAEARIKADLSGNQNYNLSQGDAYSINFENDKFDLLINNFMFDLLPEIDFPIVLKEFKRVIKTGGKLAMVNMAHSQHWYNAIWGLLYNINPAILGGCRGISLQNYLEDAGFKNIKREFISQFTFPSEIIICNK